MIIVGKKGDRDLLPAVPGVYIGLPYKSVPVHDDIDF